VLLRDEEAQAGDAEAAISEPEAAANGRPMKAGWRSAAKSRLAINVVTVAVTLGFAYIAFSGINLSLAWRALRTSDYWWVLASLVAFGLGNLTRGLRWRSLFAHGRRPPATTVTNAMMVGYLYNNIMPARAGEAARVVVLTQRSDISPVEIVATVVLERLYDVLGILVLFFAAEPWLPHVSWFGAAAVAAIVLAALISAAALVLAVFGDRPLRVLLRPLARFSLFSGERLEHTLAELVHGLSGLRHPRLALEAFAWTIAAWLLTALCAYFVTIAFHLHLPFASGILIAVAIGAGMILPSSPAAVGVFEGAALIALTAYDIPHSSALPAALVLHLVNFVPFVLVGAGLLHYNSRHPRTTAAQPDPHSPPARHRRSGQDGVSAPASPAGAKHARE
jgi:glycosyltransferase 2 family protein